MQLAEIFPDEKAAREWFEAQIWPEGRHCPRCGVVRRAISTPQYHAASIHYRADRRAAPAPNDNFEQSDVRGT